MSLFALANVALGLVNSMNANRQAEAAARLAQQNEDRIRNIQLQDYYNREGQYQSDAASGAFDPTAQIALNDATVGHDLRQQVGNLEGGAINAGYKQGDSNLEQQPRQMSEAASLHLAQLDQNTRNQVRQNRLSEMAFASPNNLSSQIPSYQTDYNNAMNQRVNPTGLITSAISGGGLNDLANIFKRSGGGDNFWNDGGSLPTGNTGGDNGFGLGNTQNSDGSYNWGSGF